MNMTGKNMKKGDIELDKLAYWIIAAVILVIFVVGYFILKNKDTSFLDVIKNLFRFRR